MIINTLYVFHIVKTVSRKVSKETDAGTLTTKEEVSLRIPVAIKKPNRRELEEIDMMYARNLSRCIKEGILTKTMLAKAYSNIGGALSDEERQQYKSLYERFSTKQLELQTVSLRSNMAGEEDGEEEVAKLQEKLARVTAEFWEIYAELQEFENEQSQLFNQTAEVIARNKTLLWITTQMTYIRDVDGDGEVGSEWEKFFIGGEYEKQLDYYDEIIEGENEFLKKVAERASIIIGFWYTGRASTQEEFDYVRESLEHLEESVVEKPVGDPEAEKKLKKAPSGTKKNVAAKN